MVEDIEGVFKSIEENRINRLSGQVNAIPWSGKPAFSNYVPGIQQGRYYLIGGAQKSGKSSLADDLFVYGVMKFLRKNPDTNISVHIKYFSLELSKDQKILALISRLLFEFHSIIISPEDLMSLYEDKILNESVLKTIKAMKEEIAFVLKHIDFIENVRNPVGIIKEVERYAESVGTFTYKEIDFGDGLGLQKVKDKYVQNDPNHYFIVITDHLSLLQTEKSAPTIKQSIDKFSSDYCIKMRNKYNCVVVNVQQMSAQSQTKEYNRGQVIIDKLIPTSSDFAESRITVRDANLVIGIFDPFSYGVTEIDGYDICKTRNGLKDNFRQIIILANRNGRANKSFNLIFAGAISFFKELPPSEDHVNMAKVNIFLNNVNS